MLLDSGKLILLVGGGSGGSVTPLLAVAKALGKKDENLRFLFVGGSGVEKRIVENFGMPFVSIASGKFRRYWSFANLLTPFLVAFGFFQSLWILWKAKPAAILGAGSFVQVPLVLAAFILRIPVVLHQQDVVPSLANVVTSFVAKKITVSFRESLKDFSQGFILSSLHREDRAVYTGNPCLLENKFVEKSIIQNNLGLRENLPTILITGGGTGAASLNNIIWSGLDELLKYFNVVHLTGKGKGSFRDIKKEGYYTSEFSDDMASLYAISDLIVCRAGLSTITELSFLGKVAIVVPLPNTHQEVNASVLENLNAAVVIPQAKLSPESLLWTARNLLMHGAYAEIEKNIKAVMPGNSSENVAEVVIDVINK